MKRLTLLAALSLAQPAFAQAPKTIELPTSLVAQMSQYMAARPYSEVHTMLDAVEACASIQIAQEGVVTDRGQCPPVSEAIKARAAARSEAAPAPKASP